MTKLIQLLQHGEVQGHLALSLGLLALVLLVRWASLRLVRVSDLSGERTALRLTVQIKRASVIVALLGLAFIWASELRTFALSITAIAVALVIATKEMLLCVMGALLRASSGSFHVGDRIEIGRVRGDVVDHGLLATTIHEVGLGHQWTGRVLTMPNSLLLTETVINESILRKYVLHVITVPIRWDAEWRDAEAALIDVADEICADYLTEAREELMSQARDQGLDSPWVEPRVNVHIPEEGKLQLLLRMPTAARDKGVIEQQVVRRFLDALRERDIGAESSSSLASRTGRLSQD